VCSGQGMFGNFCVVDRGYLKAGRALHMGALGFIRFEVPNPHRYEWVRLI
jgi:hypothetical protein